jgi:tryptophan-rich sensory protein
LTAQGVGEWYRGLNRPSWNPPDWIFGPVWTTLFVMMAVAGWLVHEARGKPGRAAVVALWWWQLAFNIGWSGLFFALKRPDLALIEIVALWLLILSFTAFAWRVSRTASLLFAPYLAWVGFAAALNGALWWLNR